METKILKASSQKMLLQQIPKVFFEEGWIVPPFEKISCENGWHQVKVIKMPFFDTLLRLVGSKREAYRLVEIAKKEFEKKETNSLPEGEKFNPYD